tara:strand:- start:909 stop:1289 length:381 start_codon:yes stop_codon:yes gene_type:complete
MSNEEIRKKEVIKLVCRQTDYTEVEAEEKLKEKNYNYLDVIKDYMNPNRKTQVYSKSLNQEIFTNIRRFLDSDKNNLELQKDYYKKAKQMSYEKIIENTVNKKLNEMPIENAVQIKKENEKNIIDI